MKITNKFQMTELLVSGKLGNATRVWSSLNDLIASKFQGIVAIRYKEKGKLFQEGLPANEIPGRVSKFVQSGLKEELMYFNEWPPPETLILNCECCLSERYMELTYSENKNIRVNQRYASGIVAVETTKSVIDDEGWDILNDIFDTYPDSVIEFTAHSRSIGNLNKNVAIWEVRNY